MMFSFWDWFFLVSYLAGVLVVGLWFSSRQTSSDEFFMGSRRFGALTISISVLATALSAITYIGIPGFAYAHNWSLFLSGVIGIVALVVVARYFLPLLYNLRVPSAYDYIEKRFDRKTAFFCGGVFLAVRGLLAGLAIYAPSVALCAVSGWNLTLCILVFGVLTIVFTALGGMSAVIWTDVLQTAVLFGGAFLCLALLWRDIDLPVGEAFAKLQADGKFQIFDWRWSWTELTFWTSIIGGLVFNIAFFGTDQVLIQRCLASKDLRAAQGSLVFNAWYMLPVMLIFFAMGSLLYLYAWRYPNVFPAKLPTDQVLPYYVAHRLPSGMAGILIASIFAAAISTLSAVLNSLATITVSDFVRKWLRPGRDDLYYTQLAKQATLWWGGIAIVTALLGESLGDSVSMAAIKLGGLFTGPILGVFVAGIFFRRTTARGVLLGALVGLIASLWLGMLTPMDSFWVLFFGAVCTIGFALAEGLCFPPDARERERIEPLIWRREETPLEAPFAGAEEFSEKP